MSPPTGLASVPAARFAAPATMEPDGNLPSVDDLMVVAEIAEAEMSRLQTLKAEFERKQQAAAAGRRALLQRSTPRKPHVAVRIVADGACARISMDVTEARPPAFWHATC